MGCKWLQDNFDARSWPETPLDGAVAVEEMQGWPFAHATALPAIRLPSKRPRSIDTRQRPSTEAEGRPLVFSALPVTALAIAWLRAHTHRELAILNMPGKRLLAFLPLQHDRRRRRRGCCLLLAYLPAYSAALRRHRCRA